MSLMPFPQWLCTSKEGFQAETQIWYTILNDGTFVMCQFVYSYLGIMFVPAQHQMTFKMYNPKTKKTVWKSINASKFEVGKDRRTCKANEFEIKHTGGPGADEEEIYTINATLDKTVQVAMTFKRPAGSPGFKYGDGPDGGYSVFGPNASHTGKRDGIVIHRFHPMVESSGSIMLEGQVIDGAGSGMFVGAIQGMRPDTIASRWNFAFFTSGGGIEPSSLGEVRAIQMEFETTNAYGPKGANSGRVKTNVGAVYIAGKPLIVTGETSPNGDGTYAASGSVSRAIHTGSAPDAVTGYDGPTGLRFEWEANSLQGDGRASAEVQVATSVNEGEGGLIERVSVLAELPAIVRKGLSAGMGLKPYIFQVSCIQRGPEAES